MPFKYLYFAVIALLYIALLSYNLQFSALETTGVWTRGTAFEICSNKSGLGVRYIFYVNGRNYIGCDVEKQAPLGTMIPVLYNPQNPDINQAHSPRKNAVFWHIFNLIALFVTFVGCLLSYRYIKNLLLLPLLLFGKSTNFKTRSVDTVNGVVGYEYWVEGKYYYGSSFNRVLVDKQIRQQAKVYYCPFYPRLSILYHSKKK